ncbi:cytidylyltransferase domain-containing protein [Adlercreutzia sp. ZJ154]|uniref:acylneuraminate cytidylyltransferase family protein n=1 Tax=Adlercreutzia sp. ZJ154 TaxID=2709790 RepID=UPI0013EBCB10|nr:acylneuraminate cytidylyltransferase family protein [Adlercreutzia sp. ZJ154]
MIEGRRILALIPARGGSKGIPRKNIKPLNGVPLIAYTIKAALQSKYVDGVCVSTDDDEIAEVARRYGANVPFMRPAELALDTSKTIECVIHARDTLNETGDIFDIIVILQPTCPLRTFMDIDNSIEHFVLHNYEGLVSVSEVQENPVLMRTIGKDFRVKHLLDCSSTIRRQNMPKYYRVDGSIAINLANELTLETSINDNPIAFVSSKDAGIDIDTIEDFRKAESLVIEAAAEAARVRFAEYRED